MIPKKIHYCWFGGKPIPDEFQQYMDSWREFCPDYEIIRWDESNYDVTKNRYMWEAYEAGKWGFVPDYLRLDIVYKYGGIYLDTDIELIKKPDELLYQEAFGCVDVTLTMNLGSGFGACPGSDIIRELRDYYDNVSFYCEDGSVNLTPCNTHNFFVIKKYNYQISNRLQNINGMNIYPMSFQGINSYTGKKMIVDNTYWIHYSNMSWMKERYGH